MHFMLGGANAGLSTRRRVETRCEITRCAQRLADERGLDGFTMDELAEAVGVSRRTLFNYVPSKIDAVLGTDVPAEPEPFKAFRNGQPTGDLVADIRQVGASVLDRHGGDPEEIARLRRLLRGDPRLVKAIHERLEKIADRFTQAIMDREGAGFDPASARLIAKMTLCAFDLAMDEYLADPSVSPAEHFRRVFDTAAGLFASESSVSSAAARRKRAQPVS